MILNIIFAVIIIYTSPVGMLHHIYHSHENVPVSQSFEKEIKQDNSTCIHKHEQCYSTHCFCTIIIPQFEFIVKKTQTDKIIPFKHIKKLITFYIDMVIRPPIV